MQGRNQDLKCRNKIRRRIIGQPHLDLFLISISPTCHRNGTSGLGSWAASPHFLPVAPYSQPVPRSRCSLSCRPGSAKKKLDGKPPCCYACAPCAERTFSAQEGKRLHGHTATCGFPDSFLSEF
uniref:GPCR family 3 nine cysteines domain-containing protein n=1 Tax=Varanus komodoensis TaxID=61221 RepID=A0A8D2J4D0_VARKO